VNTAAREGSAAARLEDSARRWSVVVDDVRETRTSVIAFGRRRDERVVLKIVRENGDEWHSGRVLAAFGGGRFAHVLEQTEGAMLLERLDPGSHLTNLVRQNRDDEATDIIASIVSERRVHPAPNGVPRAEQWLASFEDYASSGDGQISEDTIAAATSTYASLCRSQGERQLLHGDLQHYNVLSSARGWVAIDPKGVLGERAFEAGAFLRNRWDASHLVCNESIVKRRADRFARGVGADTERVLAWAFAQAVLSMIWMREDGERIAAQHPSRLLAETLMPRYL
jgi:streptomycin 6-kinase